MGKGEFRCLSSMVCSVLSSLQRLQKKISNLTTRHTVGPFLQFHPLPGIGLFEKEKKMAILEKVQESVDAQDADQTYETRKNEMWGSLEQAERDSYEIRAALVPMDNESSVPALSLWDLF
jgi:hypothetical protein